MKVQSEYILIVNFFKINKKNIGKSLNFSPFQPKITGYLVCSTYTASPHASYSPLKLSTQSATVFARPPKSAPKRYL